MNAMVGKSNTHKTGQDTRKGEGRIKRRKEERGQKKKKKKGHERNDKTETKTGFKEKLMNPFSLHIIFLQSF